MLRGINGSCLMPADLGTAIDAVAAAGYDVLEVAAAMLDEFLAQGHTTAELVAKLDGVSLRIHSIDSVEDIDTPEGVERERLIAYCHHICGVAEAIGCPHVQMVSGTSFADATWPRIRGETARGLREMADIAAEYGRVVVYEPLAWVPVRSLEQALEVIDEAGRPNVGVLVDTFQVYAGGGELDTIRRLDPGMMPTVHLADTAPRAGDEWSDDDRYAMPGDGIVPMWEIMRAVLDTGYDGVITDEISFQRYADWDRLRVARTLKGKGDAVLASL